MRRNGEIERRCGKEREELGVGMDGRREGGRESEGVKGGREDGKGGRERN